MTIETKSIGVYLWHTCFLGQDIDKQKELRIIVEDIPKDEAREIRCVAGDHLRHNLRINAEFVNLQPASQIFPKLPEPRLRITSGTALIDDSGWLADMRVWQDEKGY